MSHRSHPFEDQFPCLLGAWRLAPRQAPRTSCSASPAARGRRTAGTVPRRRAAPAENGALLDDEGAATIGGAAEPWPRTVRFPPLAQDRRERNAGLAVATSRQDRRSAGWRHVQGGQQAPEGEEDRARVPRPHGDVGRGSSAGAISNPASRRTRFAFKFSLSTLPLRTAGRPPNEMRREPEMSNRLASAS